MMKPDIKAAKETAGVAAENRQHRQPESHPSPTWVQLVMANRYMKTIL
jgi:hypothetical protein